MSSFAAHGAYSASIQGHVLVAHCRGSWNIEMHQEQAVQSKLLAEALINQGPWGTVVILHDTLVTSVAVLQAGRDAVAVMPDHTRPKALAWVIDPSIEGYALLIGRYANLYQGLLPTRVFEQQAPALAWVESMLASAEPSALG